MKKTVELCRPCAEITGEKYEMKVIVAGKNRKISCEMCQRRRYGCRYALKKKEVPA